MNFLDSIRKARPQKTQTTTHPTPLISDCQGLYAKQVWRSVLNAETKNGQQIWIDAASHLLSQIEANSNISTIIDFKCGTGSRGTDNTRVAPCSKQYQRLFGNKRRQYHWLNNMRPRVIPETHFSLTSAARHYDQDDTVWFAKEPGLQRGTGITVMTGAQLQQLQQHSATHNNDNRSTTNTKTNSTSTPSTTNSTPNTANPTSSSNTSHNFSHRVVYQRAIADGKIACVNERKADLRMYILVEPSKKQNVYVYNDAVVRIAPHKYNGNKDTSLETQLTNVSTGGDIIAGKTWQPFNQHFNAIQILLKRIVVQLKPWFQKGRCELLGVDVMIDESGRPWLVELNGSPSFRAERFSDSYPVGMSETMLQELLHRAVYPELRRQYQENQVMLDVLPVLNQKKIEQDGWVLLTNFEKEKEKETDGKNGENGQDNDNDINSNGEQKNGDSEKNGDRDIGNVRFAYLNDLTAIERNRFVEDSNGKITLDNNITDWKSGGIVGLLSHPNVLDNYEKVVVWKPLIGEEVWIDIEFGFVDADKEKVRLNSFKTNTDTDR